MALTRDFKETVMARARRDPAFREGLLAEAIECFLAGDVAAGKILLRDFVNATLGFQELARVTGKTDTSLMRMLGPKGNPAASNLFEIVAHLQRHEGVRFQVTPVR
ncbi:MAG: transcriptional regulator [Alphaproteobacteria bacterium]|jgi:DNA-binding phage protein|nr:transcriptional regulator [Alphaproteobacteria bacterium]MDP6517223.1 transcriptional regulator [Alphaproteobacteria bacterium]|tara:strand:+ start:124 stop:441 length:318 start_codon:yes stop_codon:yes gene_type:complete